MPLALRFGVDSRAPDLETPRVWKEMQAALMGGLEHRAF